MFYMKIKLYFGMENAIKKSGIGRAFYHQKKALTLNNIEFTTDKNDLDYDILHINTIYPDSISMIKQARENNKKIIYHAHSTEEDFKNSFMFSNSFACLYKKWLVYLYNSLSNFFILDVGLDNLTSQNHINYTRHFSCNFYKSIKSFSFKKPSYRRNCCFRSFSLQKTNIIKGYSCF